MFAVNKMCTNQSPPGFCLAALFSHTSKIIFTLMADICEIGQLESENTARADQFHIFTAARLVHCLVPSVLAAPSLVMMPQYAGNAVASTEAQDG